jgi:hypothetical protein
MCGPTCGDDQAAADGCFDDDCADECPDADGYAAPDRSTGTHGHARADAHAGAERNA